MRLIVVSLISSMPSLASVFTLLLFLVHLFAVVCVHFFNGKMRQFCYDLAPGETKSNFDPFTCPVNRTQTAEDIGSAHVSLCSTSIASGRKCPLNQCCGVADVGFANGVKSFD